MTVFQIDCQSKKFDSAADLSEHLEKLKALKDVTEVHFGGNTYGVDACKALKETLVTLDKLEVADLSDIFTGRLREEIPQSLDYLVEGLLECPNLHTVNLSDNAFGIATIEPLEKFLSQHVPLQHLYLANSGFGPLAGSRVAKALQSLAAKKKDSAGSHPPLETIVCGRNRLETGSMAAWAECLATHGTIKELRLYQNGIRQEGIEELFLNGLSKSPKLEKLDLQDNTFTIKGAVALTKALSTWSSSIRELVISDCLLSAKGAELFGEALLAVSEPMKQFETLKLQYNEIESDGLELLYRAIEAKLPNLKVLELNGNRFSEEHDVIADFQTLFDKRGHGELDELDDMEELTDEEAEEEEEDEEDEEEHELRADEERERETVAQDRSKQVDDLASKLDKAL